MSHRPDDLFAALLGAPALPGARCRGRHHLFDAPSELERESPATTSTRHAQALQLCQHCTALPSCAEWFDNLKPSKRPTGVVAGRIHPKPVGRPHRKETA